MPTNQDFIVPSVFCCPCSATCRPYYTRIKQFKVIIDRPFWGFDVKINPHVSLSSPHNLIEVVQNIWMFGGTMKTIKIGTKNSICPRMNQFT